MGTIDNLFSDVIRASKAVATQVDPEMVRAFISAQDDVRGEVRLTDIRGSESNVGSSSGILLFTAHYKDASLDDVSRDLVLRYDPNSPNRLFLRYDLAAQFRVQAALAGTGVPVSRPLWLDATGDWLGTPGFVMERVNGVCPNQSAFTSGLFADVDAGSRELMLDDLARTMATLHGLDVDRLGLADFMMPAEGDTAVARIINMRWKTWEWIEPAEFDRLVPVRKWLLENLPATRMVLTHGDSSLGNYMFAANRVSAVLDWELSSVGAGELDVAIQIIANELNRSLAGAVPIMPSEQEWIDRYEAHRGLPLVDIGYFKRLGRYLSTVTVASQARHLPEEIRKKQRNLADHLWQHLEN